MEPSYKVRIERAIDDLRQGKPLFLYDFDGREEETDLIYYGRDIDSNKVSDLRYSAGAPLSVYIDYEAGSRLGLRTFQDLITDLPDDKHRRMRQLVSPAGGFDPRFSLSLDHRQNKTGCTHVDTANTIRSLGKLIIEQRFDDFETEFRSPGHVPLIVASDGLLKARNGHTELILRIAQIGSLAPIMVASEILDRYTGKALELDHARAFADSVGAVFITGEDVMAFS